MGSDVLLDERDRTLPFERSRVSLLLRRAALITSKSEYLTRRILQFGVPADRIMLLRWGIDRNLFHPHGSAVSRERLGIDANAFVVLSPRSMSPLYNQDVILRAHQLLLQRHPNSTLVLCDFLADPKYREALRALARNLGTADKILWLKEVAREQMPVLYSASDVAVSIPKFDGMPVSVIEAMACGAVNVVGDLPNYRELLQDGKNVLYTRQDPMALAERLDELARNRELRERLRLGGQQTVADQPTLQRDASALAERMRVLAAGRHRPQPALVRWHACLLIIGDLLIGGFLRLLRLSRSRLFSSG
jgi:glycosyltransferase involved in cell wall biosynthesis